MLPKLIKKEPVWHIRVEEHESFTVLMIQHSPRQRTIKDRDLYIQILGHFLGNFKTVVLSQIIDEWQQNIRSKEEYANSISKEFAVNVLVSADFSTLESPSADEHTCVIHTIGAFNHLFFEKIMRFGMTNLPNVVYGLREDREISLETILEWNRIVTGWFNLQLPDTSLSTLIHHLGFLSWTSDGHLALGISKGTRVTEAILYFQDLSQGNSWNLNLST